MAKTKYDYSGTQGDEPMFGGIGVKSKAGKKTFAKKPVAAKAKKGGRPKM